MQRETRYYEPDYSFRTKPQNAVRPLYLGVDYRWIHYCQQPDEYGLAAERS
jgi:hypothetical protein